MSPDGTILHLQRLSTEDGPGLRTTVFFKGCPLGCAWCHNPESLAARPEIQWLENRCIGCQTCVKICPHQALTWTEQGPQRDRAICQVCGACAEACPANAQELLGIHLSTAALLRELLKDRNYYTASGGGVTLSGGEPALQANFALDLLRSLHAAGVPTALDTCGLCHPQTLELLAAETDLFLFDIKILDTDAHRRWTGAGNARILANLTWLGKYLAGHPEKKLWVRTPLIRGATLSESNLLGIGAWLQRHLGSSVERWELCAFNNLCREKYRRLDRTWQFAPEPLLTEAELAQAGEWARLSGFDLARISVTGSTRVETR
jgi:pyruvate formate lyase activating enzyme